MEKGSKETDKYSRGNPHARLDWPLRLSEKIVVAPPYGNLSAGENELVIRIDPGLAFGSGTHPTTALCLSMIETYLKKGDDFLDVGTGSGILMIAAAQLGAEMVVGIDKNERAAQIARQNLILNDVEEGRFQVMVGNLLEGVKKRFDMVVANILTEIVVDLLDDIGRVLKKSGLFICSGMIERNTHRVVSKMKRRDLEVVEMRTKEYWVSITAKQKA
ncbi:MAG: 50S ribosomal protein L11 methyltransferase [Deltaproteobacteria bacterium]|nr:MAG: 50S ribosomal protein L11 methyltransferase [Deltaproteobacteria bacterium]